MPENRSSRFAVGDRIPSAARIRLLMTLLYRRGSRSPDADVDRPLFLHYVFRVGLYVPRECVGDSGGADVSPGGDSVLNRRDAAARNREDLRTGASNTAADTKLRGCWRVVLYAGQRTLDLVAELH